MRIEVDPAARLALLLLLQQYGIDGYLVPIDGWDDEGYDELQRDPVGRGWLLAPPDGLEIVTVRHNWPEGFPLETFRNLAYAVTGVI